jgi:hypothetical protein
MNPDVVVPLGAYAAAIILAIGVPLVRAFTRRIDAESKQPRIPADVEQRLERIERGLDAVAIEVERISEGQRFTTKLLAEDPQRAGVNPILLGKSARERST